LARDTGTAPPESSALWVANVAPRIRDRLAHWGLIARADTLPRDLEQFTSAYIDQRDDWSPGTRKRMANVRRHMLDQLGPLPIASITPGDAERFGRWCRSQFAASHAGKIIADARQYFAAAVKERALAQNPFDGIDASQPHNLDRAAYVSPDATRRLLDKSDANYAALIALARFAGLRTPSEPLALRWQDVDFAAGRFTVPAKKTGRRVLPIFPELRPHLEHLHELAPPGAVVVFDRNRGTAAKVYRHGLKRIIKAAGLEEWPKLWMNLRASCRTDLLERFPGHVVNYWLGHTARVGSKHYDRVHDGHYSAACGVAGGVASPENTGSQRK
jgi:integrase